MENRVIERKFKAVFVIKFCLIIILGALFVGVGLYLFYGRKLGETYYSALSTIVNLKDILIPAIVFTILLQFIIFSIVTILLTLFISHRIAGPVYRLERVLNNVSSGDLSLTSIRLRTRDQIQSIADSFALMSKDFGQKIKALGLSVSHLKEDSNRLGRLILEEEDLNKEKLLSSLKQLADTADIVNKELGGIKTGRSD